MGGLWPRVLAAAVAVVLVAILLKVAPPFVVLVVFVVGIAFVYVTARRRVRAPERAAGTELLGLKREASDPFDLLAFPVALFGRTSDPAIEDLVWGRWRSLDVHAFALTFERPAVAGEQPGRATLSCAMARLDGPVPGLVVEPETFPMLVPAIPPGEPVDLGDPAFHAAMRVRSDDEDFARGVLDAPTRAWLRSLDPPWGVEVRGQIAMVYGHKPDRPDLIATLEVLRDLMGRLPTDREATSPPSV